MFLSRLQVAPGAHPHEALFGAFRHAYATHRLVWSCFPDQPDQPRDFLYREQRTGRFPRLLVLSAREPRAPRADLEIETKPFAPALAVGDWLEFSLRVNPVVRRARGSGKGKRHDVILDARKQAQDVEGGAGVPTVRDVALAWLEKRAAASGFALNAETVEADNWRRHQSPRKAGQPPVSFGTVDLRGALQVRDTDLFHGTLRRGLGSARAFGCGMMLIRRA